MSAEIIPIGAGMDMLIQRAARAAKRIVPRLNLTDADVIFAAIEALAECEPPDTCTIGESR